MAGFEGSSVHSFKADSPSRRHREHQRTPISIQLFGYAADRLLATQRGHWTIENQLHCCWDVTFHEDHSRARTDNAAEVLNILRKLALQLLKQETSVKGSLRYKRLPCGYDIFYAFKVLAVNIGPYR